MGVVYISTTPVQAACVGHMCKAGSYSSLRPLLPSVCSSWAQERSEPPLCECMADCKPPLHFVCSPPSHFVCLPREANRETQLHLARRRDHSQQGRPSSARAAGVRAGRLVARVLPERAVSMFSNLLRWWCRRMLRLMLRGG